MVWVHRSPVSVGKRGVISSFKLFLPVFATHRGRGGTQPPVVMTDKMANSVSSSFHLQGSSHRSKVAARLVIDLVWL